MVRADGTRYCDMTGSGSDDYIVSALDVIRMLLAVLTCWLSSSSTQREL